jgi:hypothetical protein
MSSPIDDESANDRLKYAPPWARQQPASNDPAATSSAPQDEAASSAQPRASEPSDHPRDLDLPPQALRMAESPEMAPRTSDPAAASLKAPARLFEGDRAVRELRARMALNPHGVPEPPEFNSSRGRWKSVWKALGITVFAAGAAFIVVMFVFPEARRMTPARQAFIPPAFVSTPKTDRTVSPEVSRTDPARLVVVEQRRAVNNEPVPLGVTLTGGPGRGAVLISGLAEGTQLTGGAPIGSGTWRVPLSDLARAKVIPPDNFIGSMEITVALLTEDAKVADKNIMRIEWASADGDAREAALQRLRDEMSPSAAPLKRSDLRTLDREEIEVLVKRGRDFILNGDLAAARLVLRRAANGGDAQAALLLGTTFDPATFEKLQVIGAAPDPDEARNWYQRAIDLGSVEAERRLAPLARGKH